MIFWVTLVGDTITEEEALPTYESWLMDVEGIDNVERNGWSKWIRMNGRGKIVTVIY
jgi:acyl-[acyl-carrier-protein] desaturase